MTLPGLLALTGVGFAVGFLAGLVGIGGGVVIVPFLYFFYQHPALGGGVLNPSLHATVAHATSLFIIVPTAVVGTATYARSGLVAWRAVIPIAIASTIAATAGALLAAVVPAHVLKVGFGVFLLVTAVQLVARRHGVATGPLRLTLPVTVFSGLVIGLLSALLGVGGGLVAIPLLLSLVRLDADRVAATSLAIVAFAASAGTIAYMAGGIGEPGLPRGHVGFVHLAAALPMLPGAMLAARWGAKLNQRLDAHRLRWIFAVLFLVIGLRLILVNTGLLERG